ncbi:peptidase yqhT [Fusarium denticulatum]|uniref:Peptidase yqhT n=1 Tax=Fusarium denticulatum TaxID=48507 RepID=A0A8H5WYC7_9HYPO|nr:peptidase yqhT [Fusarium denticulatum]
MVKYGLEAAIISDPVCIRYLTGTWNMQVFIARNPHTRYLLLTATRSIIFEFAGCLHLAQGYETVDEVRTAKSVKSMSSGPKIHDKERADVAIALKELSLNIVDAQQAIEMARTIKLPAEVKCVDASLRATEVAVGKPRDAIAPSLTENQL